MSNESAAETAATELDYHERFVAEREQGRFVVPWCQECGLRFWHPRRHCPECGSTRIDYVEPTWPAHIYTYTVNHRPKKEDEPGGTSTVGYVELEDGLRILSTLEVPLDGDIIGMAVRPDARSTEAGVGFVFVPATGA
ncbi:MAG: OB-fold domain-containing protein [Actinomycetota bacterium]|nr:OB-fold domain-containing protein [Actinomycetota bacterium]